MNNCTAERVMNFANRICKILHDEHRATLALMRGLERLVAEHRKDDPPDTNDPAVAKLLVDLSIGITNELGRHFDFEEKWLFSYLTAAGDDAISAHLMEEHGAIRPLAGAITKLVREAQSEGFDGARWSEFRRLAQEFCERIGAHVDKEENALLPALEESMNAEVEAQLYEEYAETV
jgi:hemerythrin-like domain-containing protein